MAHRPFGDFSQQQDRPPSDLHRDIFDTRLDPRVPTQDQEGQDFEELYTPIDHELSASDKALFGIRIAILIFFVIALILVILDIARENLRLRCWRLYLAVSFTFLVWLGLSIFQDHIDEYYVQEIYRIPQKRSIYWCFRNLFHGITLYLVVILLSRLSDLQNRGWWFFIIFGVVLVPLIYSIALLIIDLSLDPDKRLSVGWNVAIDTVRVFLYNVVTSVVCIIYAPRFCTRRLIGTYSEHRSPVAVLISRWTVLFLILHNLTAIASYGAVVASRVNLKPGVLEQSTEVHRALEEALLFLMVMCVPVSYVAGMVAGIFCNMATGDDFEQEMELNKVWTTPIDDTQTAPPQPTTAVPSRPQPRPSSTTDGVNTNPSALRTNGAQNGAKARGSAHGSNTTLESIDFTLAQPSANGSSTGLAEMAQKKKRNRESYLEAVSADPVNDQPLKQQQDGRTSRTSKTSSEPIDL